MPRFSVLIPTRLRHDTLKYSIETVLAQTYEDYEVVVANNLGDRATTEVIESFGSPRVKEARADRHLAMAANWELALDHSSGEYITAIGDDDGLMPDALQLADVIVRSSGTRLLTWPTHDYFWPNANGENNRDCLAIRYWDQDNIVTMSSRALMLKLFGFVFEYAEMPMVYNGMVHRSVVESAKARVGKYFAYSIPDIFSGIVNLHYTETFVRCSRPLAIRGWSGHSLGGTHMSGTGEGEPIDRFFSEAEEGGYPIHPSVVASKNVPLNIAGCFASARDQFFPDDAETALDYRRVVAVAAGGLGYTRGYYDSMVEDIRRVALMHGLDPDSVPFAPRTERNPGRPRGPFYRPDGKLDIVAVDCRRCGVANIAEAVRLATAMTPPSPV